MCCHINKEKPTEESGSVSHTHTQADVPWITSLDQLLTHIITNDEANLVTLNGITQELSLLNNEVSELSVLPTAVEGLASTVTEIFSTVTQMSSTVSNLSTAVAGLSGLPTKVEELTNLVSELSSTVSELSGLPSSVDGLVTIGQSLSSDVKALFSAMDLESVVQTQNELKRGNETILSILRDMQNN